MGALECFKIILLCTIKINVRNVIAPPLPNPFEKYTHTHTHTHKGRSCGPLHHGWWENGNVVIRTWDYMTSQLKIPCLLKITAKEFWTRQRRKQK